MILVYFRYLTPAFIKVKGIGKKLLQKNEKEIKVGECKKQ